MTLCSPRNIISTIIWLLQKMRHTASHWPLIAATRNHLLLIPVFSQTSPRSSRSHHQLKCGNALQTQQLPPITMWHCRFFPKDVPKQTWDSSFHRVEEMWGKRSPGYKLGVDTGGCQRSQYQLSGSQSTVFGGGRGGGRGCAPCGWRTGHRAV